MQIIKVFIIDDSVLIRVKIKNILSTCKEIKVIGEASNPVEAFARFSEVGLPDVFILDLEMPKMNGLEFLKKMKSQKMVPTIIYSSYVKTGSSLAIDCLSLGAFDIILKDKKENKYELIDEFISKIKSASKSKNLNNSRKSEINKNTILKNSDKIIAIGASTGGVQTLEQIFINLAKNHAPIIVVQHMPAGFTRSFAKSLNSLCKNSLIKEAVHNDLVKPGVILIAPGGIHLEIKHIRNEEYKVVLKDFPKVSSHKPSVDVLFTSIAKEVKNKSIAFILTGMGKDGAQGMKKIKEIGGKTYGQNEESCVVYGMPKIAYDIGAINKQVRVDDIAYLINKI